MGDAFWAAREGDALLHTSFMADMLGAALEVAANILVDVIVVGTMAFLAGVEVASLGCSTVLMIGFVTGVAMYYEGWSESISNASEEIANAIFPPKIEGHIISGSNDTWINGKRAARAAATTGSRKEIEALEEAARRKAEEEQRKEDAKSAWDVAKEYLEAAGTIATSIVTAPVMAPLNLIDQLSTEEGREGLWDDTKHFFSELWQPTVTEAFPGSTPKPNDKINCEKHPSSFTQFLEQKQQALMDDPVGTILGALNPIGALENAFQAVSGLIGSVSNLFKGDEEPPAAEYIAEGARDVRINDQPAARSGVRCTCEAKVVDEPGGGEFVSPDVRIGGPLLVVRDIKSGKSQITLVATIALMFLRPGKALAELPCFLGGVALGMLTQRLGDALLNPVNAATGAKYLADEEDFDFSLPGHYPLDWQRTYSSRDERTEGMFGRGWSVPYEVSLEPTPDSTDDNCMTYVAPMGRRIDLQAVEPGSGFYSPGEGLAVRRSEQGHWLISSDDGVYRLFETDPHNPQRQRLKMLGDRNSNCLHLKYDDCGRLTEISSDQQRPCIRLYYELAEYPQRVTRIFRHTPEGEPNQLRRYRYDEAGRLNGVVDSAGQYQREFAYDDNDCMTMHRQAGGERYYYRWAWFDGPDDKAWRVTAHHTDSGEHYRLDWQLDQRALTVTDSLGRTRRHWWNAQNQITRYQDASGQVTEFTWSDEERLLLGMTDPQGGRWRYVYDRLGHLTETHDPLGRVEQMQWHEIWHQPVTEADAAGAAWRYEYDKRGNLLSVTDPAQQKTQYRYDRHGQVEQVTDARGGNNYLRWNEDGQLIRHTDCSGSQTAWFYDAHGQLERVTDAEGNTTRYHHDSTGNLVRRVYQDGREERFLPDAAGRLAAYTSPTGQITRYRRDSLGRVRVRTDSMGRQTGFEYDAYGRLTALENGNGERYGFCYDALDRVTEQTDLDGRREQFGYNALGAVTAVTFATGSASELHHRLERDAAGRLTAKITPETRTEYQYDAADRLLEIRRRRHDAAEGGEPEVIRFSYDSPGNLLSEETVQGALQHQYDALGNRTATRLPDGRTLRHLYYGSGHLQQINLGREVISEFTRDHLHREVQRSQGRLDTRRVYDQTGRLTRKLTCKGMRGVVPETFISREYAYNGQDELLKKRHSRQGVTDYFYDTTGRITACRNEAYLDSWQYDAAANLLDRRQGEGAGKGNAVRFNRLTSYRGLHYRYDEHGRTVEKRGRNGTQHYRWDAEHRLTEVRVIRGSTVRRYGYVYDALGRRTEKHELDADNQPYNRTTFLWDGMRLAQECRLGRSSSLYIYSDQGSYEPLARVDRAAPGEPDEVLYYHTDVNGAPEEMTDREGNIVWEAGYQVWGNLRHEKESRAVEQSLRFQGQYLDREAGLHYNLHRYFDPDVGRFLSSDPIGLAGGINLYAYAPNPLSWIDPLGLRKTWCGRPQNKSTHHSTRKEAREAAAHAHNGKMRPQPSKNPPQNATPEQLKKWREKWERYNKQQKYDKPESHPHSSHPEPHYHEGQKPDINRQGDGRDVNNHHTF
ncbi:RHS repeat-associated core domain-containing protein [Superficieibacter sp. HKU1]|uniref:RHS repeat-associated core domain-containing protein n=1 Tax=Superficieibacter sp. HKU1 TaxID=3031919 RepID=UPI0023E0AE3F|nr:RHS repeat-associated core domain-containing protein [Superficieibacter sp. HKU1]WES69442.1 RHS repeat-associated core domain-containing protein [Superficieibacter sp. HKU1]